MEFERIADLFRNYAEKGIEIVKTFKSLPGVKDMFPDTSYAAFWGEKYGEIQGFNYSKEDIVDELPKEWYDPSENEEWENY